LTLDYQNIISVKHIGSFSKALVVYRATVIQNGAKNITPNMSLTSYFKKQLKTRLVTWSENYQR
jgi:hypothetical protein